MSIRVGSVFAGTFYVIFGLIWIAMTSSMSVGPGALFSLVGVLVIAYGLYIIVRSRRDEGFRPKESQIPEFELPHDAEPETHDGPEAYDGESNGFCPYCGSPLEKGFQFCGVCGRKL